MKIKKIERRTFDEITVEIDGRDKVVRRFGPDDWEEQHQNGYWDGIWFDRFELEKAHKEYKQRIKDAGKRLDRERFDSVETYGWYLSGGQDRQDDGVEWSLDLLGRFHLRKCTPAQRKEFKKIAMEKLMDEGF